MAAIRHVVLSDLHLGALNSVLTSVSPDGLGVDAGPSEVLVALGECLRSLKGDDEPPQLVLLGDMMELALTPLNDAATTLGHFVKQTGLGLPGGAFGSRLRYVAGNHDHYMWTRARSDHDLLRLEATPVGADLPPTTHVTSMLAPDDGRDITGRFVTAMAAWAVEGAEVEVHHSYPNFGLVDATGSRAVVMHHGHFIEHLYRIVSTLDQIFDGTSGHDADAGHLERDNGGWIDFFWSSEGDSGDVGSDIRMLYESLVSGRAIDAEIERITDMVLARRRGWASKVEAWAAKRTLKSLHAGLAARERHHGQGILSEDAEEGLQLYLRSAVSQNLLLEVGQLPEHTTFVFGHTHKPFVGTRGVPGYPKPVRVANTGGWVVDHPRPEPVKGANMVLVDEDLAVATIEVFRQLPDGSAAPARVVALGPHSSAFADEVTAQLARHEPAWTRLNAALSAALVQRRVQLDEREKATEKLLRHDDDALPDRFPMAGLRRATVRRTSSPRR